MLADVAAIKVRMTAGSFRLWHLIRTQEVTTARSRFPKPIHHYKPLNIFGSNIVGSEGEQWKKFRKISAPAFSEVRCRVHWVLVAKSRPFVRGTVAWSGMRRFIS